MGSVTANDALRAITDDYWEAKLEASPLFASFLGDHRFDDRADDLSEEAEAAQRETWSTLLAEAEALDTTGFDETDRVTHQLLAQELRDAIVGIDARLIELAS